jgi:hypothetical protein
LSKNSDVLQLVGRVIFCAMSWWDWFERNGITTALMISDTTKLMMSRFLFMRSISTPPKDVENQLQRRHYSIKWSITLMRWLVM